MSAEPLAAAAVASASSTPSKISSSKESHKETHQKEQHRDKKSKEERREMKEARKEIKEARKDTPQKDQHKDSVPKEERRKEVSPKEERRKEVSSKEERRKDRSLKEERRKDMLSKEERRKEKMLKEEREKNTVNHILPKDSHKDAATKEASSKHCKDADPLKEPKAQFDHQDEKTKSPTLVSSKSAGSVESPLKRDPLAAGKSTPDRPKKPHGEGTKTPASPSPSKVKKDKFAKLYKDQFIRSPASLSMDVKSAGSGDDCKSDSKQGRLNPELKINVRKAHPLGSAAQLMKVGVHSIPFHTLTFVTVVAWWWYLSKALLQ